MKCQRMTGDNLKMNKGGLVKKEKSDCSPKKMKKGGYAKKK